VQNFGKHLPPSLLVLPEGERSWVFSLFVFAAFCSGPQVLAGSKALWAFGAF